MTRPTAQTKERGAGPGRRTKLTPELQQRFVQALRAGNWLETCCDYVGIHPDTYYGWMERARVGGARNQIYNEFSVAVRHAKATAEIESVARIRLAGSKGNLKADIFYLERAFPERWGKRRVEVTGKDGTPLNPPAPVLNLSDLGDDELQALEGILARSTPRAAE
ncbi:hypothetical protein GCM10022631_11180 [Deinococcus rubellus]|uniref:hypothetical protein n=1 Tax=Deinococcus rubellus TaxID=1889240 RepID=UPI0031F1C0DB